MIRVLLTIGLVFSLFCSFACVQKGGTGTTAPTGDTIRVGVYGDTTGATNEDCRAAALASRSRGKHFHILSEVYDPARFTYSLDNFRASAVGVQSVG